MQRPNKYFVIAPGETNHSKFQRGHIVQLQVYQYLSKFQRGHIVQLQVCQYLTGWKVMFSADFKKSA